MNGILSSVQQMDLKITKQLPSLAHTHPNPQVRQGSLQNALFKNDNSQVGIDNSNR